MSFNIFARELKESQECLPQAIVWGTVEPRSTESTCVPQCGTNFRLLCAPATITYQALLRNLDFALQGSCCN